MMIDFITFLLDNLIPIIFQLIACEKYRNQEIDKAIYYLIMAIYWKLLFSL
jgi:hypothetical protein